jgi:hypothetical protein
MSNLEEQIAVLEAMWKKAGKVLVVIIQVGHPFHVKCNSSQLKGTTLFHAGARKSI